MFPLARSSTAFSLVIAFGAYATGALLAGLITVYAAQRVGIAVLAQLSPATAVPRAAQSEPVPQPAAIATPVLRREAAMTPLYDRWAGQSRARDPRIAAGAQFGGSSRNPWRSSRPWGFGGSDDEDDERPSAYGGTYRTLCVRMCDGYYFPVSFATSTDHIARDRAVCENRCGNQGRLFVHRNPGGSVEDMQDLQGRPYRQLRTAFLYRTEYVASCTCQPQPWEAASQERHRAYALAAAARRGSMEAMKELLALQAKARQQAANPPDRTAAGPAPAAGAPLPPGNGAELGGRDGASLMRLGGGDDAPKARAEPPPSRPAPASRGESDWSRRAFNAGNGG